eukprot:15194445-Heterocapsa_arctica.AAC.1
MLCELHGPFLDLLRGWCSGGGPAEGGFVYCLFTRTTAYIGKASIQRQSGEAGLAARLMEHI